MFLHTLLFCGLPEKFSNFIENGRAKNVGLIYYNEQRNELVFEVQVRAEVRRQWNVGLFLPLRSYFGNEPTLFGERGHFYGSQHQQNHEQEGGERR